MSEKLDGNTIYKRTHWIIMDKKRKLIVKDRLGRRGKYLCFLDKEEDLKKRIVTYSTGGVTKRSIKTTGFSVYADVRAYLEKEYNLDKNGFYGNYKNCLEAVEATIIVRI
jgi:hypothetical protein